MKNITIYDTEAERIERTCEENDMTEAELMEMLMEYLDMMKAYNGLR